MSDLDPAPDPSPAPDTASDTAPDAEPDPSTEPWRRLNGRMLLVHPLRELIRYLPVLLIALVAGAAGGEPWWAYVLSGLGVVFGVLRFLTTTYRITPTHVQVRRGVLNRRVLSAPRDRIRSVDVDSTLLHRIFGLAVVKVGTGASHGQDELELNAVAVRDVPALRDELLRLTARADAAGLEGPEAPVAEQPANLSRWRPGWVRYAPLTLSGVASIVAVAFAALQLNFFEGGILTRLPVVEQGIGWVTRLPLLTVALWAAAGLVVIASVVAMVRYALAYHRFSIHRSGPDTLHIGHGLIRARQITLDETRLRGVQVSEPLSLRVAGAASAHAIMTGLGRQRGGVALLAPPGPREEAVRIAAEVLHTRAPLEVPLVGHGPRAHRRRYTRAASFAGVLVALALVAQLLGFVGPYVWWAFLVIVPASALLAADRWRGLGHALLPGWLIAQSGSLNRRRAVLATEGIIGWTIRRSFFQRRAGLATLIATTAAGRHKVVIPDLPDGQVWPIIEAISLRHEVLSAGQYLARYAATV
ncbi:PH domain-containing protein [Leifsonia poae]|uniref:Membrane protein n=1 Tax=Leifsonia poae TaxID=110933 RepID=A0A9W6LYH7_9MICO|nr:PH domain-containing protein [Leifsonia poae]GLJ74612.1 membrane protein [Leifsonia poae]